NEKRDEFMDKAMFILISYGQQHEAKRLENAYAHRTLDNMKLKELPASSRFRKIESDQQLFEKALSEEEKCLIKWLSARMDKKELRNVKGVIGHQAKRPL
ncbi:hypothetical protein PFISCL1PPCAC_25717, partial [Pristionchus fissidentatus]